MRTITFTIPGKPLAWQRVGNAKTGGHFVPKHTVNYQNLVKAVFASTWPGFVPVTGPVAFHVVCYFPIPKSTPKKWLPEMSTDLYPYIKAPDFDNLAKISADALNQIAYLDDKQIYDASQKKYYSIRPRVEITISWMEGEH